MRNGICSLVFFFFTISFACLAVSGASRLFAGHENGGEHHDDVQTVQAWLSDAQTPLQGANEAQRQQPSREKATVPERAASITASLPRVRCDANGNVLGALSYMRAVYQVFSLGDGFA